MKWRIARCQDLRPHGVCSMWQVICPLHRRTWSVRGSEACGCRPFASFEQARSWVVALVVQYERRQLSARAVQAIQDGAL